MTDHRPAFETWAQSQGLSLERKPDGSYLYRSTEWAWVGWQAGRQAK